MVPNFDTHRAVRELEGAGLTPAQAEKFVSILVYSQSNLVTKDFLKSELVALENRLLLKVGAMQIALGGFLAAIKFFA